jgi:phosphotransferase system HPr (HPr) family protein
MAGIHLRPSGVIKKATEGFSGRIILRSVKGESELHSVVDIIIHGLKKNDWVEIKTIGDEDGLMLEKLTRLFETEFDFPQTDEVMEEKTS